MTLTGKTAPAALILSACGFISAPVAAHADQTSPVHFSGYVTAATDGASKDTSETLTSPQAQLYVQAARGPAFIGAKLKNVDGSDGRDSQSEFYLGMATHKAGLHFGLQAGYKIKNGAKFNDNHYFEWKADVSRAFGPNTVKLEVEYSPDSSGITAHRAYWTNLSVARKLNEKWAVSAGVGARRTTPAANYNGMDIGVTYTLLPKTSFDLRYFDTDQHDYGDSYKGRLVLKLTQAF